MRQIGVLPKNLDPEVFRDYLLSLGVRSRIDDGADGWPVWILNEDQVAQAREELTAYLAAPLDARYQAARTVAESVRKEHRKREKEFQKNFRDVRDIWAAPGFKRRPLTVALIAVAIVVFFFQQTGSKNVRIWMMLNLEYATFLINENGQPADDHLSGIRSGEIWRLITPIFMHVNILHIIFNLSACNFFGTLIETRRNTLILALLVLVGGVVSNTGQYLYMERVDPGGFHRFQGMSGVLYALFGYVWMKTIHEPEQGMVLHPNSVLLMLGWLVLCMTGALGPIANAAHLAGLVVGMIFGLLKL